MERADKIGFGVASAGHVLLFAALSANWWSSTPLQLRNDPIEVSIVDEVALRSAARRIAETPPPPAPGEEEGPPEEAMPRPEEKVIEPTPEPSAKPLPAPSPVPTPKPEPRKIEKPRPETKKSADDSGKQAKSRGSKLKLDLSGISRSASDTASEGTPAAAIGDAQKTALDAEIRRQLKPHWKAPTGADVESLRTIVTVRLAKDGSIIGSPEVVDTLGITASNRTQVQLHQEQAVKAIRLAAPFRLPPALYSGWNYLRLTFDKRLSQ
tara:strand:- start:23032 stop:23832 length:801 start_codon:yes stop_codon:yes gene_type:complete